MRYFIEISYNGKNYFGWQIQPNHITVQEVLEDKLSVLLREKIKLTGAGRTDTGVHARQLFAHFDAGLIQDREKLIFKLNSFLPKDIAVRNIFKVKPEAHSRFDAIKREYHYLISLVKDPFLENLAYQIHHKPDVELMNLAAEKMLNHTDFQCFSRSRTDVRTYNCRVEKAVWTVSGDTLLFTVVADRFLRNMVRAMVGTLLKVGSGEIPAGEFQRILDSRCRTQAGPSAPAHGLYLVKIDYPESVFLEK